MYAQQAVPEAAASQVARDGLTPEARSRYSPTVVAACLTLLALVLRVYRIGAWGFESDEVFMQRDSIHLKLTNPRPLLYALNHYLVQPFLPLDELGIRFLPALFGVLAVPAFYWVARRLVGPRAALFGAFLVATNPILVYYSQFGRYWTLVFLLASIYPYALYLGLRDGRRMVTVGVVAGILAVFAHPVSILLLGGLAVWFAAVYLTRDSVARLLSERRVRWGLLVAAVLAVVIAVRFVPMLQHWVQAHDEQPVSERGGEFLLHAPGGQGIKQVSLLLAYVVNLTPPVVLAGSIGLYLLWREQSTRKFGWLLVCLFLTPIAFIALVSIRTAVSTFYLVPAIPVLFIGAGVFLDRLVGTCTAMRPGWLLPAAVTAMIFAAGAPTLLSQYRDGRRYDFRGAAHYLGAHLTSGDAVYSDQPQVVGYYLPAKPIRRLVADPDRLIRTRSEVRDSGGKALWVVTPAPSHAFRTNPKLSGLNDWIYGNCQLRTSLGVGRMDFRQNFLQIFRCPAVGAELTADDFARPSSIAPAHEPQAVGTAGAPSATAPGPR